MVKSFEEGIGKCKVLIKQAHDHLSVIPHATKIKQYDEEKDGKLDFTSIYLRHAVSKKWFVDPTYVPDVYCSQLGRHIAIGEEKFLVQKMQEYAETSPIRIEFQVESLMNLIGRFIEEGYDNPVVFAPIKFYTPLAIWGFKHIGKSIIDFSGWPRHLLLGQKKIPLFYSSKYVEFDTFMIVDKTFSTLIFQPGNVTPLLSIKVKPDENDSKRLDILVVTKVFYKKERSEAIQVIELMNEQEKSG